MVILIDGYNLFKMVEKTNRISKPLLNHHLNSLVRYAAETKHKIVIVFDGGPDLYPVTTKKDGIAIIYSGTRESADDLIKRYISLNKSENLLLVSSDRELKKCASSHSVECIESHYFYSLMTRRLALKSANLLSTDHLIHKTTKHISPDIDSLMESASENIFLKEDDQQTQPRKGSAKKLSKKVRKKLKLVDKI